MLRATVFFNQLCHMNIAFDFMQIKKRMDNINLIKINLSNFKKISELETCLFAN